ncbi:hypothetical protein FGO68_gene1767 [Halteria grandinella]|uniref:Uncharacterized protein n=1 Tax=Halteria grandinella TaxID=5974 RepID=A0A8J8NYS3_HALGN|nr:hypothetical protein FGO68_gene1767 [Halteria grandinella]
MCPFSKEKCGNSDSLIIKKTGASKSLSQSLLPGDVCLYTTHAECGVPTLIPSGQNVDEIDLYTIHYDDQENGLNIHSESSIPLPAKSDHLDKQSFKYNYYTMYVADWIRNDIYSYANFKDDCSFVVTSDSKIEYYSAWGCDNTNYFMDKRANPYFGYRFFAQPADDANSSIQVIFTNGINTIYPKPNATTTIFPDASYLTVSESGVTEYFGPRYYYLFYYDPRTHKNQSSNGDYDRKRKPLYERIQRRKDSEQKTLYREDGCNVTKTSDLDGLVGTYYSYICSNGSYIFYAPALGNFFSTPNYADPNQYRVSGYIKKLYKRYELFANYSFSVAYNESSVELHQYIDPFEFGYKTFMQNWTEGLNQFYFIDDPSIFFAKCLNGSIMFYPPSDLFKSFLGYKSRLSIKNQDQETELTTADKQLANNQAQSTKFQKLSSFIDQYANIKASTLQANKRPSAVVFPSREPVTNYEFLEDGTYKILFQNGTIVNVKYEVEKISVLGVWIVDGQCYDILNLYSPDYWNQIEYNSGAGFFYNKTSQKWQYGKWDTGIVGCVSRVSFFWDLKWQELQKMDPVNTNIILLKGARSSTSRMHSQLQMAQLSQNLESRFAKAATKSSSLVIPASLTPSTLMVADLQQCKLLLKNRSFQS